MISMVSVDVIVLRLVGILLCVARTHMNMFLFFGRRIPIRSHTQRML